MVLTERQLAAATDPRRFDHGMDYVRYVHGLRVEQDTAQATIQARRVYQTALAWTGHSVEGDCSCPDAANGFFCKHQVAVGLAVLEDRSRVLPPTDALYEFVQSLAHDELVELLLHLVDRDQEVRAVVMARAAAAGQAAALDPQDLVQIECNAGPGHRGLRRLPALIRVRPGRRRGARPAGGACSTSERPTPWLRRCSGRPLGCGR